MTALTPLPPQSAAYSDQASVIIELAKCLKLVAPVSMSEDAQKVWLQAAADALQGIHANEIAAVSAEVRRSVTSHGRIVSRIADLVHEKRQRTRQGASEPNPNAAIEESINREARERRYKARNQEEVEQAWRWERNARADTGLPNPPIAPPFTRDELDNMTPEMAALGLKYGFLERLGGQLVETGVYQRMAA